MRTWILCALLLGSSSTFVFAQVSAAQVSRAEIQATLACLDKIRPLIYRQRQQLTPRISPEDQQQLAAYHARARQRAVEERNTTPLLQEHVRKQHRRTEVREWQALQPLILRYTAASQQLTSQLAPQQQQWHAELRGIHRRYAAANHTCTATELISSIGLVDWMLAPAGFLTMQLPEKQRK